MRLYQLSILFFALILQSCNSVRESAGVTRKSVDEFMVLENPPLVIPPDFNLIPPDQLEEKNIDNLESELASEILFGLEENNNIDLVSSSTMDQILSQADALNIDPGIREEINNQFDQELKTDTIFQINWENEVEVLDAIKESERIRMKKFEGSSISDGDVPIKKEIKKLKKKKRFFFF